MKLRQPAGDDRSGGKSAESVVQAWTTDGDGEKISATVCGRSPQLRYPPIVLSGPAGIIRRPYFCPAGQCETSLWRLPGNEKIAFWKMIVHF